MVFRHAPNNNGNYRSGRCGRRREQTDQMVASATSLLVQFARCTAGGVVFGGDTNRRIVAFDGGDEKILWELPLNSQPGGFPMTYVAGGKQYVAIPVGPSLIGGSG
jgi:hypothetical protein